MNDSAGETTSLWMDAVKMTPYAPLTGSANTGVCVVGAGIAGLTTAYLLVQEGKKVIVLDDGPVGGGETGRTTAHVTNAADDYYFEMEKIHGAEGAKLLAESHSAAIDLIEKIAQDEGIDCGFERLDGYLFLSPDEKEDTLKKETEAARKAGLKDVELLAKLPVDFYDFGPCVRFPRQAIFHPLMYLEGLAQAITKAGGIIHCDTHVELVQGGKDTYVTTTEGHRVHAEAIVVATNAPINDGFPVFTKQSPYRSFVITARIPAGSVKNALYWDTEHHYHYARVFKDETGDYLIVGGEDHKTGQANDAPLRYQRLEAWAKKRFPMMQNVVHRWSGQVMEPADGVAMIGRNPNDEDNIFIITGDSGYGITHGTIGGMLTKDLIVGRENLWEKLYSPGRFPRYLWEFTKENANVARMYLDVVMPGKKDDDIATIPLDSGAVIQRGLKKIAVYKDKKGDTHELSAVCPHKGGIIRWNSGEKSWDCPCHGSRFDRTGQVVNGPSSKNLPPVGE